MHYRNERAVRLIASTYETEDVPAWKLHRMVEIVLQAKSIDERLTAIDYLLKNTMQKESV